MDFVGEITGDGKITLIEDEKAEKHPVDIELEHVLGSMPRKLFKLKREQVDLQPIKFPQNLTIKEALDRVLRLPSVGSKRFLTNKVDRCVTGQFFLPPIQNLFEIHTQNLFKSFKLKPINGSLEQVWWLSSNASAICTHRWPTTAAFRCHSSKRKAQRSRSASNQSKASFRRSAVVK